MRRELKELLKPPFIYGDGYKWDWDTYHIRAYIDGEETAILKVMPIADHSYYNNLMGVEGRRKFIRDLTEFTIAAMNEKWERDFHEEEPTSKINPHIHCPQCRYPIYKSDFNADEDGEPLRWIPTLGFSSRNTCPKCNKEVFINNDKYDFCPHCGRRVTVVGKGTSGRKT